jgi:hypothetical protein
MCQLCGKKDLKMFRRWYQYDNGEQFIGDVCEKCTKLHDKLIQPMCGDCLYPVSVCGHAEVK